MERLKRAMSERVYPEKILQFGEGNFLRAFADWQIQQLNKCTEFNGSVVVVQPRGQGKTEALNVQQGLFTLRTQGIQHGKEVKETEIIQSISRGMDLFNHYEDYLTLARSETLRFIFSNTTEAGIVYEAGDTLACRPQKSFPAKLTAFLYERFQAFKGSTLKGLIVIPCELIEDNGTKLQAIILRYAQEWQLGEAFTQWVVEANVFCNSLVDRIVTAIPDVEKAELAQQLGYVDDYIVAAEPYYIWVIEMPEHVRHELPVAQAGLNTIFVEEIQPYRLRKVRILNGAHTALTPVAYLANVETVGEAMQDGVVGRFIEAVIREEIQPVLPMDQQQLRTYTDDVLDRFRNPFISHYVTSIALNSFSKFKARNVPTITDYVQQFGQAPQKLSLAFAALIVYYKGERQGEVIPLNDDASILAFMKEQWTAYETHFDASQLTAAVLAHPIWEQDLNEVHELHKQVTHFVKQIVTKGMRATLEAILTKEESANA